MVCEFDLSTLASLGKFSARIPDVFPGLQGLLDGYYAEGNDKFCDITVSLAQRTLKMIRDRHTAAWETFVSRNMTTRTILRIYEGSATLSEFKSVKHDKDVLTAFAFVICKSRKSKHFACGHGAVRMCTCLNTHLYKTFSVFSSC